MPFIIDGHNLIPKMPGMSLKDIDDEEQLVARLKIIPQRKGKNVDVYFDNAPPGMGGTRRYGRVTVHFVRQGMTADEAIRRRLGRLRGEARNWSVVSSDHQVQAEARAAGAQVLSSEVFARWLLDLERRGPGPAEEGPTLSPHEVEQWLEEFRRGHQKDDPSGF